MVHHDGVDRPDGLSEQSRDDARLISFTAVTWTVTVEGACLWAGPRWAEMTGQSPQASRGGGWLAAVPKEDRPGLLAWLKAASSLPSAAHDHRILVCTGAGELWVRTQLVLGPGSEGQLTCLATDVSDLQLFQNKQAAALATLQHRVRNALGIIRFVARATLLPGQLAEDYAARLDGRIAAFGRVQAAIIRDPNGTFDLSQIVADELAACAVQEGDGISIEGPLVRIAPKAAEIFGLALHELAVRSAHAGALGQRRGRLAVMWEVEAGAALPVLRFSWYEFDMRAPAAESEGQDSTHEWLRTLLQDGLKAAVSLVATADHFRLDFEISLPPGASVAV